MLASSAGTRLNLGPGTQAPHVVPLHERTWNWYAVPVVVPILRLTVVLVAVSGVSVTGLKAPSELTLLPVATCSSERLPVPVQRTSTAMVLLPSGWLTTRSLPAARAARLWTGAVAVGVVAAGVLPASARYCWVVLAASSAKARNAWRLPAAVGLK